MVSLNDFVDPDLTASDVLHSSGYAEVAARGIIGAAGAGSLSIDQRRQQLNKPRTIGAYQYSHLGSRRNTGAKARDVTQKTERVYDASAGTLNDRSQLSNRQPGGTQIQKPDRSVERRQHFIEPPSRTHNPFA